jgi:hypothetical protein
VRLALQVRGGVSQVLDGVAVATQRHQDLAQCAARTCVRRLRVDAALREGQCGVEVAADQQHVSDAPQRLRRLGVDFSRPPIRALRLLHLARR